MPPGTELNARTFPNVGQATLLMLGALVLQIVGGIMLGLIATLASGGTPGAIDQVKDAWFLLPIILLSGGVILAIGLRGTQERTGQFLKMRPFALRLLPAIMVTTLGFAVVLAETDNCIVHLYSLLTGSNKPPELLLDLSESPLGGFLLVVIAAPVLEEYLFRGMILRGLLIHRTKFDAIVISALLFAVFHANIRQGFLAVVLGLVFGWWYVRTRSIGPSLIGHMVFNGSTWAEAQLHEVSRTFKLYRGSAVVLHEPWWLVLGGLALTGLGLWSFHRSTRDNDSSPLLEEQIPPLLNEPPLLSESPAP